MLTAADPRPAATKPTRHVRAVPQVARGNFLEMYDLMAFGYYPRAIARSFFPAGDEFASPLLSLMSFQSASQQVAVIMVSVIAVALGGMPSDRQISDRGWRLPLPVGLAIVPLLFVRRRLLRESEAFLRQPSHRPCARWSAHWGCTGGWSGSACCWWS